MIDPEIIRRIKRNRDWIAIQDHFSAFAASLDSLPNTAGKDDRTIAAETIGRVWARDKLKELLQPFIEFQDSPDTGDLAKERAEDAGL